MFRIVIDGVTIRFVEGSTSVRMVVEGTLPQATIDAVVADLQQTLTALEGADHDARRI